MEISMSIIIGLFAALSILLYFKRKLNALITSVWLITAGLTAFIFLITGYNRYEAYGDLLVPGLILLILFVLALQNIILGVMVTELNLKLIKISQVVSLENWTYKSTADLKDNLKIEEKKQP